MKKRIQIIIICALSLVSLLSFSQLNESFEGDFPPADWTVSGGNASTSESWSKGISTTYFQCHHTGEAGAVSQSYIYPDEVTPDNWLITPQISVLNNDSIIFYVKPSSTQYPSEHFELWLSETGTEITDFTEKLYDITFTSAEANDWNRIAISLSNWNNSSVYLAFVHNNCTGQDMLMIDDVSTVNGEAPTTISSLSKENPTFKISEEILSIKSNSNAIEDLSISDIKGTLYVKANQVNSNKQINISYLKSGIYFLKFKIGSETYCEKFFKQ